MGQHVTKTPLPRVAGKLVDEAGQPLIAAHSSKAAKGGGDGRVRYGYYVSADRHKGKASGGSRIPTREFDGVVIGILAEALDDPLALRSSPDASPLHSPAKRCCWIRRSAPAGVIRLLCCWSGVRLRSALRRWR